MREAVIVSSVRTPGGRAKRGGLKDTRVEVMGAAAMNGALARVPQLKPETIEDVVIGCSFPEAEQGLNLGRVLAKYAKLPDSVPGFVINRFCSSGLQAIALAAQNIMAGWSDVVLAGGVESMSRVPMGGHINRPNATWTDEYPDVYASMGITAENVAKRYEISRTEQDEMGVMSNERAAAAQEKGWFKDELVPVAEAVKYIPKPNGGFEKKLFVFDADDGVRKGTTMEGLGKLKPAFSRTGSVTAGNSSQMTDGAAASVLMSMDKAKQLGVKPLAKFHNFQVVGVRPDEMGVGPRWAIPKLLDKAGKKIADIDLFEINEAFASQALYSIKELGIPMNKVNVCGGAIALGHPLGCTGAKLIATLINQLARTGGKWGVVSMCIGGGMGAAGLIERLD